MNTYLQKLNIKYYLLISILLAACSTENINQNSNNLTLTEIETLLNQKQYDKALPQLKQYAKNNNNRAQYMLAQMYDYGSGVKQNDNLAFKYYQKAALNGNLDAMNNLGVMYQTGQGTSLNYAKALLWFKKAADQQHAPGQNSLGYLFDQGLGVKKDIDKAKYWYQQSASQNYALAQTNLAILYELEGDLKNALFWYKKAALKQDIQALYNLGILYETGKGVEKNLNTALEFYQKAHENGVNEAQDAINRITTLQQSLTPASRDKDI